MTTDRFDEDLRRALDDIASSVPESTTQAVLARDYAVGGRHRGVVVAIAASAAAAAVVAGSLVALADHRSPRPAVSPPVVVPSGWQLVSDIGEPAWHPVGTTGLGPASLDCPTTTTCYEEGTSAAHPTAQTTEIDVTHDAGRTWSRWDSPPGYLSNGAQGLSCATAQWCVTYLQHGEGTRSFFVTGDGGLTWQPRPGPADLPYDVGMLEISCPTVGVCTDLGASSSGPGGSKVALHTTDGWQTWTRTALPAGEDPVSAHCAPDGSCVSVGFHVVAPGVSVGSASYSLDGGSRWVEVPLAAGFVPNSVSCGTPTVCVAVDDATYSTTAHPVEATTDGGRTWTPEPAAGLPPGATLGVACAGPSQCWASAERDVSTAPAGIAISAAQLNEYIRVEDTGNLYDTADGGPPGTAWHCPLASPRPPSRDTGCPAPPPVTATPWASKPAAPSSSWPSTNRDELEAQVRTLGRNPVGAELEIWEPALQHARSACLAGLGIWNDPAATFRTGGFAVHFVAGWNSLAIAVLERNDREWRELEELRAARADARVRVCRLRAQRPTCRSCLTSTPPS